MTILGHLLLAAAIAMSLVVTVLCVLALAFPSASRPARRFAMGLPVTWFATMLVLEVSLVRGDTSLAYVAEHVNSTLPTAYRYAALWAGQEGSLLAWTFLLSCVCALLAATLRGMPKAARAVSIGTLSCIVLCMGLILAAGADPFHATDDHTAVSTGAQQLRHWAMLIHPPLVFAGYSACAAPFAIACGAFAAGSSRGRWVAAIRSWALCAWLLLGAGIVLGAWWAYTQLGWGGYWAWDPVENASLIPWLTVTALIHSAAVYRRHGTLGLWTAALAMMTFVLCVFGTFVTRGGMIQSIHSFGRSTIGVYLALMLVLLGSVSGAVLFAWSRRSDESSPRLAATPRPVVVASSVWLMIAGLLLLTFAAAAVVVGTAIPMVASLLAPAPASVSTRFYESTVGPAALIAAMLMAISPAAVSLPNALRRMQRQLIVPLAASCVVALVAWCMGIESLLTLLFIAACVMALWLTIAGIIISAKRDAAHHGRWVLRSVPSVLALHRRLHGARLAHLGLCVLLAGVCCSTLLARTFDVTLHRGQERDLGACRITLNSVTAGQEGDGEEAVSICAQITLVDSDGAAWRLSPRRRHFMNAEQPVAEVAIRSSLARDLYVGIGSWDDVNDALTVHVRLIPGVMWIWIGAALAAAGGVACAVPVSSRHAGAVLLVADVLPGSVSEPLVAVGTQS